jgi:2-methylisocitrate lyase-like PEP mutase family enzyme
LHHAGTPLILVNAWDAASARIVEAAGAPAVATTSAGVAWSLGAPDGDALNRDLAVALVSRVAAAVAVPVTADIESGFGATPAEVGQTVLAVIRAGAVGVNIEDAWCGSESGDVAGRDIGESGDVAGRDIGESGDVAGRDIGESGDVAGRDIGAGPLRAVGDQCARLAAARAAARESGVPVFINARVDTFLRGGGIKDTVARASAYLEAGADGVFVPGVVDPETIAALVAAIAAPLNILVGPGAPPVPELARLGVARASLGSAVAQAAYAVAQRAAVEAYGPGTYDAVKDGLDYSVLNGLMGR